VVEAVQPFPHLQQNFLVEVGRVAAGVAARDAENPPLVLAGDSLEQLLPLPLGTHWNGSFCPLLVAQEARNLQTAPAARARR